MADRYPNRPFPADDPYRGNDQHGAGEGESDPLAELARLIGQTDPFGSAGRANPQPRAPQRAPVAHEAYQQAYEPEPHYEAPLEDEEPSAGPPPWLQRANIQRHAVQDAASELPYEEPAEEDYPSAVHPLHRYAAQTAAQHDQYREASFDEAEEQSDPGRYDDALYGQLESGAQDFQRDPAYPDDPYAYQDGYEEEPEAQSPKRRGGLLTVAAVLALAVVGTGAAFAYRTYVGSPRSGEPPIIKADNTPTKVVPASADSGKTPDRLPPGDGSEKMVSREETPVDVKAAGPRIVLPPLNQNSNPPPLSSVSTATMPPANAAPGGQPSNGTLPSGEPRKIKTFSVHGDQPDSAAAPVTAAPASTRPAANARQMAPPAMRNAPAAANAPLSLSPDTAQASMPPQEPRTRVAAIAPSSEAPAGEGRYLVQVSSQKTEADAQSSYRALQRKFPDLLSSRSPVIRHADLGGDKGTVYRAMVGPFASREEAARFCSSYKTAGGQCFVP